MDSTDTEAFHSAVLGLQERVDALLGQAAMLEDAYQHPKASFDNILATMHQEIHNFANQASRRLCNEYKCHSFDRIAQDHAYMDITPFVSNVIQNVCTFDALLTFFSSTGMVCSAPPNYDGADPDGGRSHSVPSGVCAVPDWVVSPRTAIHSEV